MRTSEVSANKKVLLTLQHYTIAEPWPEERTLLHRGTCDHLPFLVPENSFNVAACFVTLVSSWMWIKSCILMHIAVQYVGGQTLCLRWHCEGFRWNDHTPHCDNHADGDVVVGQHDTCRHSGTLCSWCCWLLDGGLFSNVPRGFCRAMICKCSLCHHAVSVLSVCPTVTFKAAFLCRVGR